MSEQQEPAPTIFIAGSIVMDIAAVTARLPKPGETVLGERIVFSPGGKGANQAVAAARLGARVSLIGRVGEDPFGRELRAFLATEGVDIARVGVSATLQTGAAIIAVADTQNAIVIAPGANSEVRPRDFETAAIDARSILVSQLEIPIATVTAFSKAGREAGATTILNLAPVVPFDRSLLDFADIIVLNEIEIGAMDGREFKHTDTVSKFIEAARRLQRAPAQVVCVTLGARGAIAVGDFDPIVIPGHAVRAIDTTGAGDCFIGVLAARLAVGDVVAQALVYANRAAALSVQRAGTGPSMPTAREVEDAHRPISHSGTKPAAQ
ncbi:MAG TPA: ribokinase [Rhizomicrobium sp.]|nr:ribokinase [Rhizomicrobium sp.]